MRHPRRDGIALWPVPASGGGGRVPHLPPPEAPVGRTSETVRSIEQRILSRHVPACAAVDRKHEILYEAAAPSSPPRPPSGDDAGDSEDQALIRYLETELGAAREEAESLAEQLASSSRRFSHQLIEGALRRTAEASLTPMARAASRHSKRTRDGR